MFLKTISIALAFMSILGAQVPGIKTVASLSPVPLWPQDGDITRLPKGQYVFYDPPSGEYVVYYAGNTTNSQSAQPTLLRFGTHALVDPKTEFAVASTDNGAFRYTYNISNGSNARQAIQRMSMLIYSDSTPRTSQATWTANVGSSTVRDIAAPTMSAATIDWTPNASSQSIAPGNTVTGFTVDSTSRPGFTTVVFRGATQSSEYSPAAVASLPNDVQEQVAHVFKTAWDTKTGLVIGPRFSKDASQSEIAQNFLFGIQSLIRDEKLDSSSPFIQSTVRLLSAQLESSDPVAKNANNLMLSEAKTGLEAMIANALQTALTQ
jgi:hypothetical protein